MYVVKFSRRNGTVEEYFYCREGDGLSHLQLFRDDDSDLYSKIELILEENKVEKVIDQISF